MFQATLIGNLGADAVRKSGDGYEFISFRVCHNDRYVDAAGVRHESNMWVDCTLDKDAKVAEFLKAGTMVYIVGSISLRVYSSQKDRCMKAGATIRVRHIELLSSKSDPVPSRLIDDDGVVHDVMKYFHCETPGSILHSERGAKFAVDDNGWVLPLEQAPQEVQIQVMQREAAEAEKAQHATQQVAASMVPASNAPTSTSKTNK